MTHVRFVGIYLLAITLLLVFCSLWQIRLGNGSANFSFVISVPFALGLLGSRTWAIWGTGMVGGLSISAPIFIAVIHSVSPLSSLTVELGPITITDPAAIELWLLAVVHTVVIGVPMISVLTELPKRSEPEESSVTTETAWLLLAVILLSAAAAGITLWAGAGPAGSSFRRPIHAIPNARQP